MKDIQLNAAYRLTSMSFERKFARQKIQELGVQTYQHAFKLMMFPTSTYVPGWEREIKAWYKACVKYTNIKSGSFKPSDLESLLLENLFFHKDIAGDMKFAIEQNEELTPRRLPVLQAELKVVKFYEMLSHSLYAHDSTDALELAFDVLKK